MALAANKNKGRLPRALIPVIAIILAVAILTVGAREEQGGPVTQLRKAAMVVIAPLQQFGSLIGVPFKALSQIGNDTMASEETLTQLQQENEELFAMVGKLEEARLENERLKALLSLVDAYNLESTTARILSQSSNSWNQVIFVDKGSNDGIEVGMPVMSANGLLGQVEEVSSFTSMVRLITDPLSGVSVFLQASRTEGILTGSAERTLYLSKMPVDSKVDVGDVVITSGAGGAYPKGIVIGEVVSSTHNASDVFLTVVVRPVARVESFEEVVILTGRNTAVITPNMGSLSLSGNTSSYSNSAGIGSAGTSGSSASADSSTGLGGFAIPDGSGDSNSSDQSANSSDSENSANTDNSSDTGLANSSASAESDNNSASVASGQNTSGNGG